MNADRLTAIDIAHWFIAWAERCDADITNLKLQKLLYFAQGHRIAAAGQPLFPERIEAWAHGPVVPVVYHALKHYGGDPIDPDRELADFSWDDFKCIESTLLLVWDRYGILAAWALRNLTHRQAPWVNSFQAGENNEITQSALKRFFAAAA